MSKKGKPWQRLRRSQRRVNTRSLIEKILIVCEGEKTEPNYFEKFPIDASKFEVVIEGSGCNTDSLVEEAIKIKMQKESSESIRFNQVWCVFDKNSFPDQNFNRALQLANSNKIRAAYSNEAFELWYLLHFDYIDVAISRSQYREKLSEKLGDKYKKNSEDMYQELLDKQYDAIENAKRLLGNYNPPNPARDNPSTRVHELVMELNKRLSSP